MTTKRLTLTRRPGRRERYLELARPISSTCPSGSEVSSESLRRRLEAATPSEWKAATGRGKYGVIGTTDAEGRSYCLAVLSAVPATHRKADAELIAHAPTDLRLALDVIEAAHEWQGLIYCINSWPPCNDCCGCHLKAAFDAFEAAP